MTPELHGPFAVLEGLRIGSEPEAYSINGTRTPVWVVFLFSGSPTRFAPGWYVLGEPASKWGYPLAGPFASKNDAVVAIEYQVDFGPYAFSQRTSQVFDPTIVLRPEHLVLGQYARIDSFCKIECGDGVFIGDYVHIASFCHLNIGGGVLIMEEGSSAGSGSRILSGSALAGHGSCSATHPNVKNAKSRTIIRKNATVFAGATVSVGCEMGEGSVLAGGSFLRPHTTVPPGELWAGVPAVFKKKLTPVQPLEQPEPREWR